MTLEIVVDGVANIKLLLSISKIWKKYIIDENEEINT